MSIAVLEQAIKSKDELTRSVAKRSLFQLIPEHPTVRTYDETNSYAHSQSTPGTSVLVHGTFAEDKKSTWWAPGSTFHKFVKKEFDDLYENGDYYKWSGAYNHAARNLASEELCLWANQHGTEGKLNRVIAHSHGGNVAMLASKKGLEMNTLVLLGCPFQKRYKPDFKKIEKVVSVRVKLDLAVLADLILYGGRFKPTSSKIKDIRLNVWFDHAKVHDHKVWIENKILQEI